MSMAEKNKNAKAQKNALEKEGAIKVAEREKQTKLMVARQKVSFLNSGISLNSGTPEAIINDTQNIGAEDVSLIKSNYATGTANITSQARSEMLSGLGGMASTVASYGVSSGWGQSPGVTSKS
jgi:hypothetical protein